MRVNLSLGVNDESVLTGCRCTVTIDESAAHLHGPRRLAWPRTSPFHGGNTGSNPVGDANIPKGLRETAFSNQGPFGSNKLLDGWRDGFRFGIVRHDQLGDSCLSASLHRRNRLCVGVCCDFEGCVAQQLLDGLEVFAIGFHQGSKTVP